MKRPDAVDFAFAALVILVSVAPLVSIQGWQKYGQSGEYICNCGQYFVRFSDPTFGGDRPHIYTTYNGFQVDLIEVSDDASSVNGLNLYSNFAVQRSLEGGGLSLSYSSPQLNFTKTVSVNNGVVNVSYAFGRNVTALITLWRWYYASIGPFDRPVARNITAAGGIKFSLFDEGALFNASVAVTPIPVQAQISGVEGEGLNKIALTFNSTSINLTVKLDTVKPLAGVGVVEVGSTGYTYPVIGVCVAAAYLVVRRELGGRAT